MGAVGYRWIGSRATEQEGTPNTVLEMMEQVRKEINQGRVNARQGLAMLTPANNLMRAAQEDVNRWMGHLAPEGTPLERARGQHYTGDAVAVLWAEGTIQPLEMTDAWMRDPACRALLDDPRWREMGVAFGGSPRNLRCVVYLGARGSHPHDEVGQDAVEIALRDGLSFIATVPLTLRVGCE